MTFTYHFSVVGVECLLYEGKVLLSQTTLQLQEMSEHPGLVLCSKQNNTCVPYCIILSFVLHYLQINVCNMKSNMFI